MSLFLFLTGSLNHCHWFCAFFALNPMDYLRDMRNKAISEVWTETTGTPMYPGYIQMFFLLASIAFWTLDFTLWYDHCFYSPWFGLVFVLPIVSKQKFLLHFSIASAARFQLTLHVSWPLFISFYMPLIGEWQGSLVIFFDCLSVLYVTLGYKFLDLYLHIRTDSLRDRARNWSLTAHFHLETLCEHKVSA